MRLKYDKAFKVLSKYKMFNDRVIVIMALVTGRISGYYFQKEMYLVIKKKS